MITLYATVLCTYMAANGFIPAGWECQVFPGTHYTSTSAECNLAKFSMRHAVNGYGPGFEAAAATEWPVDPVPGTVHVACERVSVPAWEPADLR